MMKKITKVLMVTVSLMASCSAMADWKPYKIVTLEGHLNTIPGGRVFTETTVASGVYRFRIDPDSVGIDYAAGQAGNTRSKSAALMVYDRTSTADKTAAVSYYGLNDDGLKAPAIIHAFPQTGGFGLYLQDWQRVDNSGTVNVIIEKWQD